MYVLLLILSLLWASPREAHAQSISVNKTSDVTATVPSTSSTTTDEEAPTIPILISPADETLTNNARPEFIWERSTDPNGNYVVYALYQNDVATYLQISDSGNTSGTGYTSRLQDNTIHLTPSQDLSDGTYSWMVTASDAAGNTQESAVWTFTIDTHAPPLTLVQLGNTTNPNIGSSPTFNYVGPINLSIITSSEPYASLTVILYNTTTGNTTTLTDDTTTSPLSHFLPTLALGQYEVFISVQDQAGNNSSLPTFYLNITPPITPAPVLPIPLPPLNIPILSSLPATAMYIATRAAQAPSIYYLLALLPFLLLFARRKRNIRVLIADTNKPLAHAQVYTKDNHEYRTNKQGYAYVPHLTAKQYLLIMPDHKNLAKAKLFDIYSLCILKLGDKVTLIRL